MLLTKDHLRTPLVYFRRRRAAASAFLDLANIVGWQAAQTFLKARERRSDNAIYSLQPRGLKYPVFMRSSASDVEVFNQVFIRGDYRCVGDIKGPRLILDLGANVGYSSAFFLSTYPQAKLIAVEPDAGNFGLLRKNLAPYLRRAEILHAGVWSHCTKLALREMAYRDGREWGRQVEERPETGSISGIDIDTILSSSGYDRISLLKVDIEGAEVVLFSSGRPKWLDRVDVMAIELHDDSSFGPATELVHRLVRGPEFTSSRLDEITVFRRLQPADGE